MKTMTVAEAAEILGKPPAFVRIGLQRGLLPFGMAMKYKEGSRKFTYHIIPAKVFAYMGLPVPDVYLS